MTVRDALKRLRESAESDWTQDEVREVLRGGGEGSGPLFRAIYGWSKGQYDEALRATRTAMVAVRITRLPSSPTDPTRAALESRLHNNYPQLFEPEHLAGTDHTKRPHWCPEGIFQKERSQKPQSSWPFWTLTQSWISHAASKFKKQDNYSESRAILDEAKRDQSQDTFGPPRKRRAASDASGASLSAQSSTGLSVETKRLRMGDNVAAHTTPATASPAAIDAVVHAKRLQLVERDEVICTYRPFLLSSIYDQGAISWDLFTKHAKVVDGDLIWCFPMGNALQIEDSVILDYATTRMRDLAPPPTAQVDRKVIVFFVTDVLGEEFIDHLPMILRLSQEENPPRRQKFRLDFGRDETMLSEGYQTDGTWAGISSTGRASNSHRQPYAETERDSIEREESLEFSNMPDGPRHTLQAEPQRDLQAGLRNEPDEQSDSQTRPDESQQQSQSEPGKPTSEPQSKSVPPVDPIEVSEDTADPQTTPDESQQQSQSEPGKPTSEPQSKSVPPVDTIELSDDAADPPPPPPPPTFQYHIRYDPNASTEYTPDDYDPNPSIRWRGEVKRVGWLSNWDPDSPDVVVSNDVATSDIPHVEAAHLGLEQWKAACLFFGFDPTDQDPRSTVHYGHWNKANGLLPFQFYTVTYIVSQIAKGYPLQILASGMGFGKTPMGLAVIHLLSIFQKPYGPGDGRPSPYGPPQPVHISDPVGETTKRKNFDLARLVGFKPVVHQGLTLLIIEVHLLSTWIAARHKFIRGFKWPAIVVCHASFPKNDTNGQYFALDDNIKGVRLPPDDELLSKYDTTEIQYMKKNGIPIRELLKCDDDGNAWPWQWRFWVLTTKDTALNKIKTVNPTLGKGAGFLVATWSAVLVDEYHKNKKANTNLFRVISYLPGHPPIIALSATPWEKFSEVATISNSAMAKFKEYRTVTGARKAFHTEHVSSDVVSWAGKLSSDQVERLRPLEWIEVQQYAATIDRHATHEAKKRRDTEADDLSDDDEQAKDTPAAVTEAIERFAAWIRPQMIKMEAGMMWKPDPSLPGDPLPAIPIPPHNGFDVHVPIDEKYKEGLKEHWLTRLAASKKSSSTGYLSLVSRFGVLMLWPPLLEILNYDEAVNENVGGLKRDEAKALVDAGTHSPLWQYIDDLMDNSVTNCILDAIRDIHRQRNVFNKPRKVVVTAHKPMNIALLHMCLLRLVEKGIMRRGEWVFVDSWNTSKNDKDEHRELIAAFKTTISTAEGYRNKPWLLLAVASQIKTGLDLCPADVIITLDGTWFPTDDKQLSGRPSRNKKVCRARRTESYRIIVVAEFYQVGLWLADVNASRAKIRKLVNDAAERRGTVAPAVGEEEEEEEEEGEDEDMF